MTRPLRILVAQNVPHDRRGGMSRIMAFLHDRVEQDGHTVEYFSAEQLPARWQGRTARFAFPWLVRRHVLAGARAGQPYDVVNVHEPSAAWLTVRRHEFGSPSIVVTSHGVEERGWQVSQEDARLGRKPISVTTRIWHPLTLLTQSRRALRQADAIWCLNEEDRSYVQERYHAPAERILRIFPGADSVYLDAYARRGYASTEQVAFFGTWLERKGSPDLIQAFERLSRSHPALTLVILGAGFPEAHVLGTFPEALRQRIRVVPPSAAEVYAEHLLSAAVYVIPSVFEGTPLTLMEAMATGMPVVATATCGMRDVIQHDRNGLLIPVRDPDALTRSVDWLLTRHADRERLGRRAHADVRDHYTWDAVAQPVRAFYQQLARQRERAIRVDA